MSLLKLNNTRSIIPMIRENWILRAKVTVLPLRLAKALCLWVFYAGFVIT